MTRESERRGLGCTAYVVALIALYFACWTMGYLVVMEGPVYGYYWDYLVMFLLLGGGERPIVAGMISVVLFVVLGPVCIVVMRRAEKRRRAPRDIKRLRDQSS